MRKKLKCARCQRRKCMKDDYLCNQCQKEWKVKFDKLCEFEIEARKILEVKVSKYVVYAHVFLDWLTKYWRDKE